jgi:predicted DsbA family dithiol-disulfide isomerase
MKQPMEIEIWSDVMCPFCYIGKRRFEDALEKFPGKADVSVQWKSFQLNPQMETIPGKNINEYLAEHKGWTMDKAREMNQYVTDMAKDAGLEYHMDKAVVANSFDAHRLIQLAKKHGLGDAAEEGLFKAYFTEGKNTADHQVLLNIATSIGLDRQETEQVLASDAFADDVRRDVYEAQQVGARGVPFFVFDRKYAVSGAQASETFLQTLEQAHAAWQSVG